MSKKSLSLNRHLTAILYLSDPMDFAFNGSRNFTFIPGNTMYCFPVQTVDDMVLEDKENFSLVLSSPDPDVDLKTRMVTVKIRDNDGEQTVW